MSLLNDAPVTPSNPLPVTPAAAPNAWASSGAALTTTADRVLVGAQGGSLRGYLSALQLVNAGATATEVVVKDGAAVIWRLWLPGNGQPVDVEFVQPLRSSPNAALAFACVTAGAAVYANAQGFVA